jgi:hypothetical protein
MVENKLKETPLVSIIIVNYNGAHFLEACLDALKTQTYPAASYEVIISDNASNDGSISLLTEKYPWVQLIKNSQNLGFAAGNNIALPQARGEYIILLNNDTVPESTWLEALVDVAQENPEAGLITSHLQLLYDQLIL